jgi:hypothetical protein
MRFSQFKIKLNVLIVRRIINLIICDKLMITFLSFIHVVMKLLEMIIDAKKILFFTNVFCHFVSVNAHSKFLSIALILLYFFNLSSSIKDFRIDHFTILDTVDILTATNVSNRLRIWLSSLNFFFQVFCQSY